MRVVYFHGCSTNTYEPHIGKLAVAVLEHIGLHVEIPPQTCCGLPAQSNGDFQAARRYARQNIDAFKDYARRGIPIVGTSASCITAIKGDYQHVLGLDDPDALLVAEHTYDFMEFLAKLHHEGRLRTDFQRIDRGTALSRALPAQGARHGPPRAGRAGPDPRPALLGDRRGLLRDRREPMGTRWKSAPFRRRSGWPIAEQVYAAKADLVVCDTETCRWQIHALTGAKTIHPVELVALAYGLTVDRYQPPLTTTKGAAGRG